MTLRPADDWSWRNPWRWLAMAPWCMLALNLLNWLHWGHDLPFVDDWRAYADGSAGRWLPGHWFTPINNTMAPVGLALDALAQRTLSGNVVAYQFISQLVVQGGLLLCQWRLLNWALPDRRLAVLAFVATAFMLQTGSYWGEQNLAYHQALPLLFLMAALALGLASERPAWLVCLLSAVLGLLAGLAYISGAVAACVAGAVLALLLWCAPANVQPAPARRRAWGLAVGLGTTGVLTLALQVWASRVLPTDVQGQAIPSAMPTEPAFWAYALGKLGRALGLGFANWQLDLLVVALVWAGAVAGVLLVVWQLLASRRHALPHQAAERLMRLALVALPLAGAVCAYWLLVAHGRANFRDAGLQQWSQIYQFGYLRFHFYWLTLLLPWALAAWALLLALRPLQKGVPGGAPAGPGLPSAVSGVAVLCAGLLALGGVRSVFDVQSHYRSSAEFRAGQWACLQAQWGAGGKVNCPIFDMPDAMGALLHAKHIEASFTRYLSLQGAPQGRLLHEWHLPAKTASHWRDAQLGPFSPSVPAGWLRTGADTQWHPDVQAVPGLAQAMAQCQALELTVTLRATEAGRLQVFHVPRAAEGHADSLAFSEAHSVSRVWQGAGDSDPNPNPDAPLQTLHVVIENALGFAPALRLDWADRPLWVRVESVRLGCRLPTLAAWQAALPEKESLRK